jgi:hypothetical protein
VHSYKGAKTVKKEADSVQTITCPSRMHNHLTNSNILGDKKSLFGLLKTWKVNFQQQQLADIFEFIP